VIGHPVLATVPDERCATPAHDRRVSMIWKNKGEFDDLWQKGTRRRGRMRLIVSVLVVVAAVIVAVIIFAALGNPS
jgi:hypothetical protein